MSGDNSYKGMLLTNSLKRKVSLLNKKQSGGRVAYFSPKGCLSVKTSPFPIPRLQFSPIPVRDLSALTSRCDRLEDGPGEGGRAADRQPLPPAVPDTTPPKAGGVRPWGWPLPLSTGHCPAAPPPPSVERSHSVPRRLPRRAGQVN